MAVAITAAEIRRWPTRWWLVQIWLAGLVGYSALLWFTDDALGPWINDGAWTLASASAACVCFRTARLVDRSASKAWWLLGAACASWFVGQLFWNYNELVLGITMPYLSVGQVFYSSVPLLMLAGI